VHLPERPPSSKGGRPSVADRHCFEGILWLLRPGFPMVRASPGYGSPSTVSRRLRELEDGGVLLDLWGIFLADLSDRQKIGRDECLGDGSFAPA
jgi:transposase